MPATFTDPGPRTMDPGPGPGPRITKNEERLSPDSFSTSVYFQSRGSFIS